MIGRSLRTSAPSDASLYWLAIASTAVLTYTPLGTAGDQQIRFSDLEEEVANVAFHPDNRSIAVGSSLTHPDVRRYETRSGNLVRVYRGTQGPTRAVLFSLDGNKLFAANSWERDQAWVFGVQVWETATGRELARLSGHGACVTAVAVSANGKLLVSGDENGTVKVWDLEKLGECLRTLTGHKDTIRTLAFSADGRWLASGSEDHTAKVWEVSTGKERASLVVGQIGWVLGVAFGSDGDVLITADNSKSGALKSWDLRTGKARQSRELEGHSGFLTAMSFSPDGKWLMTASEDGTVRLWERDSGNQAGCVTVGRRLTLRDIAFSRDGKSVALGGVDDLKLKNAGIVMLFDLEQVKEKGKPK